MPERFLNTDFYQFITKILIPAFVGISLKLAVQMKKTKLSFLNVSLSFITGICVAWMFSNPVKMYVPQDYQSICIAIIAISGEKIGDFLVYKFRVDDFLAAILDAFKQVIIKMINK
jgi:hypothetical protein